MNITRRHALHLGAAGILGACSPAVQKKQDADVLILGAGLSGLHAARMLAEDGANVLVLEAASRVGGRILTLDDLPGRPEGGGQQIGQSYARIRKTALDVGVSIIPYPARDRANTMSVAGRVFPASDWAGAPENVFPEALKRASPSSVLFGTAARENPFADTYAWREIAGAADVSAETFLSSRGLSPAALKFADHTVNANDLGSYAMANVWRSLALYTADSALGSSEQVEGGTSRLTDAMAGSLNDGVIRLDADVREISADASGVTVQTSVGNFSAPFAICTLPFAVLRNIRINAPLPPVQADAIAGLAYTQILQVHLGLESVPEDGLPIDMWTDTPIERVFTVYDNAGAPVGLTCWINGEGAAVQRSDEDWTTLARKILKDLRGMETRPGAVVRWDAANRLAGGAYMHWAPGQIGPWAEAMAQPSGRLYFAGEHLSYLHTGMEGAMESGEAAAYSVIEAMSA